ncbi:hypothetical protein VCNHCC004A_001486B, partial [Vibrio cholerae O1 str. NHCC-004A]
SILKRLNENNNCNRPPVYKEKPGGYTRRAWQK